MCFGIKIIHMKFSVSVGFCFFSLVLNGAITASHASQKDEEVLQGSLLGSLPSCAPSALSVVPCLQVQKRVTGASDGFLQQALCVMTPLRHRRHWRLEARLAEQGLQCESTLPEPRVPAAGSFVLDPSQPNVPGVVAVWLKTVPRGTIVWKPGV